MQDIVEAFHQMAVVQTMIGQIERGTSDLADGILQPKAAVRHPGEGAGEALAGLLDLIPVGRNRREHQRGFQV